MNKFLYNKFFRNSIFNIGLEFQDIQELFENLAGQKIPILDKYSLIYTQIRLVRRELDTLVSMLSKIDEDFREEK